MYKSRENKSSIITFACLNSQLPRDRGGGKFIKNFFLDGLLRCKEVTKVVSIRKCNDKKRGKHAKLLSE